VTDKDTAQSELKKLPLRPGQKFTHYRAGGTYQIVTLAVQEDTLEPLVVYRSIERDSVWVRTYQNFTEEVESSGRHVPRFSPI